MGYYFEVEKPSTKSPLWFAYIWREGDDIKTAPPAKEFHSMADNAAEVVSRKAAAWIDKHGTHV
jgi:hypothetical protein